MMWKRGIWKMNEKIKLAVSPQQLGRIGEEIAWKIAKKDFVGWEVTLVPRKKRSREEIGCDIVVKKGNEQRFIEVKTTTLRDGIPDAYINEFSKEPELKFKPHYLYIITILDNKGNARITKLDRDTVNSYGNHEIKKTVRFNHSLKTALVSNKFASEDISDIRIELEKLSKRKEGEE